MTAPTTVDAPVWMPSSYTRPIENPDYSEGEMLILLAEKCFIFEQGDEFGLDDWQKWLIREVLQKFPADHDVVELRGKLVYEQAVISMGRQNGKTVLGAVFALYGLILMVNRAPDVISLASTVEQAKNLYRKTRYCIDNVPLLATRFKTTDRSGITSKNPRKPANYVVKAAGDGSGLQGFSGNLMLLDELHLLKPETWFALVLGASAQPKALVLGLTTSGDDNSELLKRLYKTGDAAARKTEGHNPRFGFFLWMSDPSLDLYDPEALVQANPAIASGRLSLEAELRNGREMQESEYRRYRRNEMVSVENTWMPLPAWLAAAGGPIPTAARKQPMIVAFARSRRSWDYVSIVAAVKWNDKVHTELIGTITFGNTELLEAKLVELSRHIHVEKFVASAETMKPTILTLNSAHHLTTEYITRGNLANATVAVHSMVKDGRLVHAGDPEIQTQIPRTVTVNAGQGVVIDETKSLGDIEAVSATVMAAFMAESQQPYVSPISIF